MSFQRSAPLAQKALRHALSNRWNIAMYRLQGSPPPPPHPVKQNWIRRIQAKYQLECFVETGTFRGNTVAEVMDQFGQVISIELDPQLWRNAVERFASYPHVQILQGDSGDVLQAVLPNCAGSCLFWLDGHYSGGVTAKAERETPILAELAAIRNFPSPNHVILIDDARLFDGANDYPSQADVVSILHSLNNNYKVRIVDDMFQALPADGG